MKRILLAVAAVVILTVAAIAMLTEPAHPSVNDRPSRVCVTDREFLAASELNTRRQVERLWGQRGTVDPHYELLTTDGEYVTDPSVILVNYRQCSRSWKRLGVSVYYEKRPHGWMVLAKMYRGDLS